MRVCLVGCGAISRNHVPAILALEGISLVALCDKNVAKA